MHAEEVFVDSRFHVAVRPVLEYAIPETLRTFTCVLLGDVPLKRLLALVERSVAPLCKEPPSSVAPPAVRPPPAVAPTGRKVDSSSRAPSEDEHSDLGGTMARSTMAALEEGLCDELRAHVARVCTHAHEYLTNLLDVWKRHANDVDVACKREAARAKYALLVARRRRGESGETFEGRVLVRPTSRSAYHEEVATQLKSLDESMDLVRNLERPNLQRSESFKKACQDLRESFAAAYGSMPTSTLARLKNEFDAGMCNVQRPLARDLVAFVTRRFQPS